MRVAFLNTYPVWTMGLPWGFRSLGHEVVIPKSFQRDYFAFFMQTFAPELLILVGWTQDYVSENVRVIREAIKKYGGFCVYWSVEDFYHLYRWSLPFVRRLDPDFVFTINASCVESYENIGIPAAHLEFACNPWFHRKTAPVKEYRHDIVLVANAHDFWNSYRGESIRHLLKPLLGNYDVAIWGKGWDTLPAQAGLTVPPEAVKGPVAYSETPKIYSSAKIVLGLQNENRFNTQVTMRTFEITGCGAFLLTSRTQAVEALFTDREHVVMSDDPRLTVELVSSYLKDDAGREEIAAAGQRLVYERHTYKRRAQRILEVIDPLLHERGRTGRTRCAGISVKSLECAELQPPLVSRTLEFDGASVTEISEEVFEVGYGSISPAEARVRAAYLSFDTSTLPKGTTVLSACLYLWATKSGAGSIACRLLGETYEPDALPVILKETRPASSTLEVVQSGWNRWDLTGAFREWFASGGSELRLVLSSGELRRGLSVFLGRNWSGDRAFTPKFVVVYARDS